MAKPFRGVVNVDMTESIPDWCRYTQPIAPEWLLQREQVFKHYHGDDSDVKVLIPLEAFSNRDELVGSDVHTGELSPPADARVLDAGEVIQQRKYVALVHFEVAASSPIVKPSRPSREVICAERSSTAARLATNAGTFSP
jgi:hypothetical protein